MPTRAYCAAELDDSQLMLDAALALDSEDEDEAELQEMLMLAACEPAIKRLRQEIGSEKLSLNRLRREAAEHGITGDDVSWNVYSKFGFHLPELETVVKVLSPGDDFSTRGKHHFESGEEAVLILLRRFRSTGSLTDLTKETGRNRSALSEIISFMVVHIHRRCGL